MSRTGWEHADLESEISNTNMAQLLELFKRENEKFVNKCSEYVESLSKFSEEGKKRIEEECKLQDEARMKVALVIAERMTDTNRVQYEVRPR